MRAPSDIAQGRCRGRANPSEEGSAPDRPAGRALTPRRTAAAGWRWWAGLLAAAMALAMAPAAEAQSGLLEDEALLDRPVGEVEFRGLTRVSRQEVRNNIRVAAGQPYDPRTIRDDVATLYRLGHFESVSATAEILPDGTVLVAYALQEQALILDLQVVGNKLISDQELRAVIPLYAGGPRDDFLLEQAVFRIKNLYKEKGHYLVEVTVDETRLRDTGILILRILEGPRVRVKEIEFVGNEAFPARQLMPQIRSRAATFIVNKGLLDPDLLVDDAAALDRFYREMGFIDVRTDWRIQLSPDNREAKVTFLVSEGRRYRLRKVEIQGVGGAGPAELSVFSRPQIEALVEILPGEVFRADAVTRSVEAVRNAYLAMGYVDARVFESFVRTGETPEVDLLLNISEGERAVTGLVLVQGNLLTRDKVIRRLVRIRPERPLDARELELAEKRIEQTRLFTEVRATVQPPRPGSPSVRDLLVEVKESDTGSVNFGVGLGSDSGIFGEITVNQRNFDIADPPLTFSELVQGRGFRGAGQTFSLAISPGTEVSNYSISFGDPHFLETDIAFGSSALYRNRVYQNYNENRYGFNLSFGRQLGDRWTAGLQVGWQNVKLTNFDPATPIEVFEDRGPQQLPSVGLTLNRSTIDDPFRPSRGTRFSLGARQFFDSATGPFTIATAGVTTFLTLSEDFLGRKSTLRLSGDAGYIFGSSAPVFERFYLGGRSFRGFEFRTISPKSRGTILEPTVPNDEPIGGSFLFFAGAQYEVPLLQEAIAGVVFLDTGTVNASASFENYRVSVGVGVRLYLPMLGPAPLAFDFGFPLLTAEGDQTQLLSFSAELPF
jgi:outer membrane protein insertion porin family